jgi:hypothetical protein
MNRPVDHTIEQFASACHDILKKENNPAGRSKVCALLQEYLKDQQFVSTYITDKTPERQVLYEDPDLGFCILAHQYHDHGPYWAIYGQAAGETEMSDYALVEAAGPDKTGKASVTRTYKLTPGVAHVYNEGDLHAPKRVDSTSLIRIEGKNMEKVKRYKFEAV